MGPGIMYGRKAIGGFASHPGTEHWSYHYRAVRFVDVYIDRFLSMPRAREFRLLMGVPPLSNLDQQFLTSLAGGHLSTRRQLHEIADQVPQNAQLILIIKNPATDDSTLGYFGKMDHKDMVYMLDDSLDKIHELRRRKAS